MAQADQDRDPAPNGHRASTVPAVAMVLGSISSIQIGAAMATGLFDEVGAMGVTFLRTIISAVLLVIIWRPSFRLDRESTKIALMFGVVLAAMNLSFYESIDRIPLGIAVTFEFIGPLGVALFTSHRRRDLIWVAMAAAGIVLLSGGIGDEGIEPLGVILAVVAGVFWGCYILLGKKVGEKFSGGRGLAIAMVFSTIFCTPFGVADGGSALLGLSVLATGAAVAILSTTLPLSLEMEALRRLPSNVFGVMMSLEPAMAATIGFLLLSQDMSATQVAAIALVVSASAGALSSARAPVPIEP
jgi:inner membrane transporter RhtA